jgi:hypothetical protein
MRRVLLVLIASALAACASVEPPSELYVPESTRAEDVAVVVRHFPIRFEIVDYLDGTDSERTVIQETMEMFQRYGVDPTPLNLPPGCYDITVRMDPDTLGGGVDLAGRQPGVNSLGGVVLEAGHVYVVECLLVDDLNHALAEAWSDREDLGAHHVSFLSRHPRWTSTAYEVTPQHKPLLPLGQGLVIGVRTSDEGQDQLLRGITYSTLSGQPTNKGALINYRGADVPFRFRVRDLGLTRSVTSNPENWSGHSLLGNFVTPHNPLLRGLR